MDPQGDPWMDMRSSWTLKFYGNARVCICQGSRCSTGLREFYHPQNVYTKNTQPCIQRFFFFLALTALKSQLNVLDIVEYPL